MSAGNAEVRELEWYLRDHLFRQSNAGKIEFRRESLPQDMVTLYLRYRGTHPSLLSEIMTRVIQILVSRKVLDQSGNELKLTGSLVRLQCARCFYINYLAEAEPRVCMRCGRGELQEFPRKKP